MFEFVFIDGSSIELSYDAYYQFIYKINGLHDDIIEIKENGKLIHIPYNDLIEIKQIPPKKDGEN